MGFEWRVAVRFLFEGRMQTLLLVVGVAAGVAVVTYITALIEGLQGNTIRRTLGVRNVVGWLLLMCHWKSLR